MVPLNEGAGHYGWQPSKYWQRVQGQQQYFRSLQQFSSFRPDSLKTGEWQIGGCNNIGNINRQRLRASDNSRFASHFADATSFICICLWCGVTLNHCDSLTSKYEYSSLNLKLPRLITARSTSRSCSSTTSFK